MKKVSINFADAYEAAGAFGLQVEAILAKAEKSQLVSQADPAGDEAFAVLSGAAKLAPFYATAPHFNHLLKALGDTSPVHLVFADRVATLAIARAQSFDIASEQIVNQLYLADISEANPEYDEIIPHAELIRQEVAGNLGELQDSQRGAMRTQMTGFGSDLSARSCNLLKIYIPGFGEPARDAPAAAINRTPQ